MKKNVKRESVESLLRVLESCSENEKKISEYNSSASDFHCGVICAYEIVIKQLQDILSDNYGG